MSSSESRDRAEESQEVRTIILYKPRALAFFVYGFAKNERDNIKKDELAAFKVLASELLAYDDKKMGKAIRSGALVEIRREQEEAV